MRARIPNSQFLIPKCHLLLLVCFLVLVVAIAAQSPSPLPEGPGKEVFESVCSLCHTPDAAVGKHWTRMQWEAKVTEMLQEEPEVTAQEREAIVNYLSTNFKPGGKIYINRAAAKDLAISLDLSTKEAEAIIRRREEHGAFKTLDDLKNVPGLDIAKIEARKDRLAF